MGSPFFFPGNPFIGTRNFLVGLAMTLRISIPQSLGYVFLLFLFRTLLRNDRLALAAAVLVVGTIYQLQILSVLPWLVWMIALNVAALLYLVLFRGGLVAVVVMNLVNGMFFWYPITFSTSAWYSGIGFAVLAVVAALTLYGFRTSLGSRTLFEPSSSES
jgi:hypothetical protein